MFVVISCFCIHGQSFIHECERKRAATNKVHLEPNWRQMLNVLKKERMVSQHQSSSVTKTPVDDGRSGICFHNVRQEGEHEFWRSHAAVWTEDRAYHGSASRTRFVGRFYCEPYMILVMATVEAALARS